MLDEVGIVGIGITSIEGVGECEERFAVVGGGGV